MIPPEITIESAQRTLFVLAMIALGLFLLSSLVHLYFVYKENETGRRLTKIIPLSFLSLSSLFLMAGYSILFLPAIFGFLFSIVGDFLLLYKKRGNHYLLLGIFAFFLAHVAFLMAIGAFFPDYASFFPWGLHYMLDDRSRYPTVQQAFDRWKDYMVSFGYGYRLGIDLPGEKRGYIPNSKVYDKIYRGHWNSSTIISIAIGQGEVLATPLQICNLAATIANGGFYIAPHVVKQVEGQPLDTLYTRRHYTMADPKWYPLIADGMRGAVAGSPYGATCRGTNLPDIEVCGKTGTAENPHGKDHSIFMGFAPYHEPRVAIAVFVENAGFGATYAVPIGRLMLEKYLRGELLEESKPIEEYILNAVIMPGEGYK